MSKILALALLATFTMAGLSADARASGAVPCEDMLADLRAAKATVTLSDDVKAQVDALEAKGVERCNADDDRRADAFFAEAMKAMGK